MNEASTSYLGATKFLDIDHESVQAFAAAAVGEARTDRDKVKRLFAAVRDQIWYDPMPSRTIRPTIAQASSLRRVAPTAFRKQYC